MVDGRRKTEGEGLEVSSAGREGCAEDDAGDVLGEGVSINIDEVYRRPILRSNGVGREKIGGSLTRRSKISKLGYLKGENDRAKIGQIACM